MAIRFGGWINDFKGPESLDNAQMEAPPGAMDRFLASYNKVMGTRLKKNNLSPLAELQLEANPEVSIKRRKRNPFFS